MNGPKEHEMSGAEGHPLEVVLRLIDQASPQPWYPYRTEGVNRQALDDVLEDLWMEGLIQKAPTSPEAGPAVELTPLGRSVLADPELLARLREGKAINPTNPAAVIRANLSHPPPVRMCKLILWANIGVFLWGLWLASQVGIAQSFLVGFTMGQRGISVLHRTGSLVGFDLLRGEWWRLITAGFNHGGVIHLGMNMYALFAVGRFMEERWGWWRFLIIYFVSVWTGSCLAMTYQPDIVTVGASGGLFGVFAAVIAWLLLYGKYLPAAGRKRLWQNVVTNVILLVVMSLLLRNIVSHWGHIGGAIGGFVTCFVLHVQRFGAPILRGLATAALLLLPAGGWAVLQHGEATQPAWARMRNQGGEPGAPAGAPEAGPDNFERTFLPAISKRGRKAIRDYDRINEEVLGLHPTRRDARKVEEALETLREAQPALEELAEKLEKHPPYRDEDDENARKIGLAFIQSVLELYAKAEEVLRKAEKAKRSDDRQLEELRRKAAKQLKAWNDLLS
jgi:membrane associated rhomboid family serine protease